MTISVRTTCVRQTFHKFLCPCFLNPIQPPKGGGDDLFIERLTENPFLIDSTLFNILIDLFASGSRKSAVSKIRREIFGEISDQCFSVIRGMKGFVRHYTGVINIAFHSTLSPEEFADGLYENYREAYADELNGIHYRHDKETALARRARTTGSVPHARPLTANVCASSFSGFLMKLLTCSRTLRQTPSRCSLRTLRSALR